MTIEATSWVLTACLLVCVVFMTWQEQLRSASLEDIEPPYPVETPMPRCYEVGGEVVIADGQHYEPGDLITIDVVDKIPPEHVRKFIDAGLITPSQRDPRPSRYDLLTEDEDDPV